MLSQYRRTITSNSFFVAIQFVTNLNTIFCFRNQSRNRKKSKKLPFKLSSIDQCNETHFVWTNKHFTQLPNNKWVSTLVNHIVAWWLINFNSIIDLVFHLIASIHSKIKLVNQTQFTPSYLSSCKTSIYLTLRIHR